MGAQQTPSTVGVALSGGGYRAALFTLGSPLYLSVAVDGRSLTAITSVSAESFTEGFIGQTTDLRSIQRSELHSWTEWLVSRITEHGAVCAAPRVRRQRFTWLTTACDNPPATLREVQSAGGRECLGGLAVSIADSAGDGSG
jgi:hypothetical protein